MTLLEESASIIRRVIVVFPDPEPPHMPIISGLFSNGRISGSVFRGATSIRTIPTLKSWIFLLGPFFVLQEPPEPPPAWPRQRETERHSHNPCPRGDRISRSQRRRHARHIFQFSSSAGSFVLVRFPIRRAFPRQLHQSFEMGRK